MRFCEVFYVNFRDPQTLLLLQVIFDRHSAGLRAVFGILSHSYLIQVCCPPPIPNQGGGNQKGVESE